MNNSALTSALKLLFLHLFYLTLISGCEPAATSPVSNNTPAPVAAAPQEKTAVCCTVLYFTAWF